MEQRTHLVLGSVLGLLVLVVGGGLIVPRVLDGLEARSEIIGFRAELSEPAREPQTIEQIRNALETFRTASEGRTTPIPKEADQAGVIAMVGAIFEQAGVANPVLTTGQPEALPEAMAQTMTISATGRFGALVQAIRRVEDLPRLVRIQRIQFESRGTNRNGPVDRSGLIEADIQLDLFYDPRTVANAQEG